MLNLTSGGCAPLQTGKDLCQCKCQNTSACGAGKTPAAIGEDPKDQQQGRIELNRRSLWLNAFLWLCQTDVKRFDV